LTRPPLLVVGVPGPTLWLANSFYSFIIGFVAGRSVAVTGGDPSRISLAINGLNWWVGAPLLVLSTYLLAQYAAHHLAHHTTLWLAASVGLFVALGLLTDAIISYVLHIADFNPTPQWIAANAALMTLLIFTSWLGKRRADSTHFQFVVVRLFRRLNAPP
jgi:hypothetical protein